MRKARTDIDLSDLRKRIAKIKEEGAIIISHYKKLEEYYSEWEDRFNKIQEEINKAEKELKISPRELEEYPILDDLLGGIQ